MITCKLSAILGERRIKITDLSKATNISRTTLTTLYYDRAKGISFEVLGKLCGYLGCKVGDLIDFIKDETK